MDGFVHTLNGLLGLDQDSLTIWQMLLRAGLIYPVGIILVRLGKKRFIGKFTAFDVILGFMLGSLLASAITAPEDFFSKIAAALMLVIMHYAVSKISFHSERFGTLVKGEARTLVKEGQIDWNVMKDAHITEKDLMSALRENGRISSLDEVSIAYMERSGNISVVPKDN